MGTTSGYDFTPEVGHDVNGGLAVFYTRGQTAMDIYEGPIGEAGTAVTSTPGVPELDPAQSPSRSLLAYVTHDGDYEITVAPGGQLTSNTTFNDTAPEWQAVDNVAPNTVLSGDPPALTNDTTPTFAFSSTEANSTFKCSIDTGTAAYGDCSGPASQHTPPDPLADGDYVFHVRATDAAGNTDPDPVAFEFTIDSHPPVVAITQAPKRKVRSAKKRVTVKFEFEADEDSTFECALDAATDACVSPATYKVNRGSHSFTVVATDTAGNTGEAVVSNFKLVKK
jgi:hypothetical protein